MTDHDSLFTSLAPRIPRGHFMFKSLKSDQTSFTTLNIRDEKEGGVFQQVSASGPHPIGFINGKVIGSLWPLF
ncbi:hypothetical protein DFA_00814 [Cavenderia fasciculata]|uniref:Uncharacterized protein n=1 Tax=Cavenderia fasciculata TaxID=261658 RepID=F4PTW6_CACFS|nr:uncharacterized protein DFA_00814 [Cavenderia fasciculata]EGG20945.1 hypothetical protein DFA_00814 [Cavenderia fasciculata]|eukprot:XP_004358795.1 hypothetical protein DFA_00814 [Cavenderia fasciculata]